MISPVWVPPSLRCSGFPGFIQTGNSPAHTGRWDMERLYPSSPCRSEVPAAPARALWTHGVRPGDTSILPSLETPGHCQHRLHQSPCWVRGFVPWAWQTGSRNTAASRYQPRDAPFPHCPMVLQAESSAGELFLSLETTNSAELLCVVQKEHTPTGSCCRKQVCGALAG